MSRLKLERAIKSDQKKEAIHSRDFGAVNPPFKSLLEQVPIFSLVTTSWNLANCAFAEDHIKNRKGQQWKSIFYALSDPNFASVWFDILKLPDLVPVIAYRQRLYIKPFRVYMSIRWRKIQKVKVILDTYRFMISKGQTFMQAITCCTGLEIARIKLCDSTEGVLRLGYDHRYRKEGELVLTLHCDRHGGMIAAAAFSFEEMETEHWACRIACIQGHRITDERSSKEVQKILHGLRPKSLLVYVIQEFTRRLGFSAVFGAGDAIQAYRRKHLIHLPWRHTIQFDYDSLWSESGGQPSADGWYRLPLIPRRKDCADIKSSKRSLYHKRYKMLDILSSKIDETVQRLSKESKASPHFFRETM